MAGRHRPLVNREAGEAGKTEQTLPSGRRVDVVRGGTAKEIERSGVPRKISMAAGRLKEAEKVGIAKKGVILIVPQKDLPQAEKAMKRRKFGLPAKVYNLSKTTCKTI